MKNKVQKMCFIFAVLITVLVLLSLIVFPPSVGSVKKFYDENKKLLPNSIAQKCYVEVDDIKGENESRAKIGMIIRGKDVTNPVLLFCGGGPGIPEYLMEAFYPTMLSDIFTVCYFDYRGTGLSFDQNIDPTQITTELFVNDVLVITDFLKQKFGKEKIYIAGHSFGSFIALKTICKVPQNYYAYFSVSQICNQKESELLAYDYMKAQYQQRQNKKMVAKFEEYNVRQNQDDYKKYTTSPLRDNAMHELGIGTTRKMKSVVTEIFFKSLRCKTYTQSERINIWRGKMQANSFSVTQSAFNFNAFDQIPAVPIPIYFFVGKYDYTCSQTLQKQYFDFVQASKKELFWFENSAHSPIFEESKKAAEIFKSIVNEQ